MNESKSIEVESRETFLIGQNTIALTRAFPCGII